MFNLIYKILDKIRAGAIMVMFSGIIIICVINIILRYFTPSNLMPFAWGDEVVRLTAIWIVFLAASIGVKEDSHLSVEFFLNKFLRPDQLNTAKKIATLIVVTALAAVTFQGIIYTKNSMHTMMQNLPNVSMAWFYASIPVGCGYLILEYMIKLFKKTPNKGKKEENK